MKLKWVVSLALGIAAVFYVGGYSGLEHASVQALAQFGLAALFVGLHIFVWRGEGRLFSVLRFAVWSVYLGLLAAFVIAYFPRGVLPMIGLLISNLTMPVVVGFFSMALPAWLGRPRRRSAVPASAV